MSLKLQVIHASDFLRTTRKGEVDLAGTKQELAEMARSVREMKGCQILLDRREALPVHSAFDIWQLAAELDKYEEFVGRKMAILVSGTGEKQEFFKMCAQNRGYLVNVFREYEEAIHWLFRPTDVSPEGTAHR